MESVYCLFSLHLSDFYHFQMKQSERFRRENHSPLTTQMQTVTRGHKQTLLHCKVSKKNHCKKQHKVEFITSLERIYYSVQYI